MGKQQTIYGSRTLTGEDAASVRLEASRRFRAQQEHRQIVQTLARKPPAGEPDRASLHAIEERIVKGLWILEISTDSDGPRTARRHGVGYMPDAIDHWADAIAKGGWETPPSAPPVPSNKEIDEAKRAKQWIEYLDEGQARLLTVAAMTKRGDRERRINWNYVKERLRIPAGLSNRTLQDRYSRALRWILAELSAARINTF